MGGLGYFDKLCSGIPTEYEFKNNYLQKSGFDDDAINDDEWAYALSV